MKKLIAIAAAAAAATACASMSLLSTGIAAADPDVVGQTYSDAKAALSDADMTPVVATVLGGKLPQDQCYVVSTSKPTFLDQGGSSKGDLIQVNLNCYPPATTTKPGFSAGNNGPAAQAVRDTKKQQELEWKKTADGQKWCEEAQIEHPEWGPIEGCQQPSE